MKYQAPMYGISVVETGDILLFSNGKDYKIECNNDGTGNITMNAFDLFNS